MMDVSKSLTYRVTQLMEVVGRHRDGVGVREAARLAGIDRSAVSRIFVQLEALSYVQKDESSGRYRIGPAFFALAATVRGNDDLWEAAKPILGELVREFNETAYLTVRKGDRIVFLGKVESDEAIRYIVDLGTDYPLVSGAAGRAVLMTLSPDEFERVLSVGFEAFTPDSFADRESLLAEVRADQAAGVSISSGRFVKNGAGVAAPFFDEGGTCRGALVVSGPSDRMTRERMAQMAPSVRSAAASLSARLGSYGDEQAAERPQAAGTE